MMLVWLCSLALARTEYIKEPGFYQIPTDQSEMVYVFESGAEEGVTLNLKDGCRMLTFKRETTLSTPSFTLRFDDDDYTGGLLDLTFDGVHVTFDCEDEIRFSVSRMTATNTEFSSTKAMVATYESVLDLQFDLPSFISGFGSGGVLFNYLVSTTVTHPKVKAVMDHTVEYVKFVHDKFYLITQTGQKYIFDDDKNFSFVLVFNDDEAIQCQTEEGLERVEGDVCLYGKGLKLMFTDDWLSVKSADSPIIIYAELVDCEWESSLPPGLFTFVNEDFEEIDDQVILYKGWERWCIYDGDTPCDVHGTYPHPVDPSGIDISGGIHIAYVLCTQSDPIFHYTSDSAPSVTFIGETKKALTLNFDGASPTENITFDNIGDVTFNSVTINCKSFAFLSDAQLEKGAKDVVKITTSMFNCSQQFFADCVQRSGSILDGNLVISNGGTLAIHGLKEFDDVQVSADSVELFEKKTSVLNIPADYKDCKLRLYTEDQFFNMTAFPENGKIRGGIEVYLLKKYGKGNVTFEHNWRDVTTPSITPAVSLYAFSNWCTIKHTFDTIDPKILTFDKDQFHVISWLDTEVCLYLEGQTPCTPPGDGYADVIIDGKYEVPEGIRYIYTLPENLDPSTTIVMTKSSATHLGFKSSRDVDINLETEDAHYLQGLYIELCELHINDKGTSQTITLDEYTNIDGKLWLNGKKMTVEGSLSLSWEAIRDFFEQTDVSFTGKTMYLKGRADRPGKNEMTTIQFLENSWNFSTADHFLNIPVGHVTSFTVETYTEDLTLDVSTHGTYVVAPINLVCLSGAEVRLDDSYWGIDEGRFHSPSIISKGPDVTTDVKVVHPFRDLDEESKKVFDVVLPVLAYSYTNCTICLSDDGKGNCNLDPEQVPYYVKAKVDDKDQYTIPFGYRFDLYVEHIGSTLIVPSDVIANFELSISANDAGLKISLPDSQQTISHMKWKIAAALGVELVVSGDSYTWFMESLELSDVTFVNPQNKKFTIHASNQAIIDMDVFEEMTNEKGVFHDAVSTPLLYLRDTDKEYLDGIEFNNKGCKLTIHKKSSEVTLDIVQDSRSELVKLGVNTPWTDDRPRLIPLTVAPGTTSVLGELTVSIEEKNVYLYVGEDWAASGLSITNRVTVIDTLVGAEKGRIIYHQDVPVEKFFDVEGDDVGLINEQTSTVCLSTSDSFSMCYAREDDFLPVLCEDGVCKINESRTYVVAVLDGKANLVFSENVEATTQFVTNFNLVMDSVPESVSLSVSRLEGDATIALKFNNAAKTLRALTIANPIGIDAPEGFCLTANTLSLDFQSFKRFFRDVGIFAKEGSLDLKNYLQIKEDARYHEIGFTPEGWSLVGNENAWNTTLKPIGSASLAFETNSPKITLTGADDQLRESVILYMNAANSQVVIDRTFMNIAKHNNEEVSIHGVIATTLVHSYPKRPDFIKLGENVKESYVPLTDTLSYCLYDMNSKDCTDPEYTPVKASSFLYIPAAKQARLVLTVDSNLGIHDGSAMDVIITGNNHKVYFSNDVDMPEILPDNFQLTLVKTEAQFIQGFSEFNLKYFKSDTYSISSMSGITFKVSSSLSISGADKPVSGQSGNPIFEIADHCALSFQTSAFNKVVMKSKTEATFSDGKVTVTMRNLHTNDKVEFHNLDVTLQSDSPSNAADFDMAFVDQCSLNVLSAIDDDHYPTIDTLGSELPLTLAQKATLGFTDVSRVIVDVSTLSKMDFDPLRLAKVTVKSSDGISEVYIDDDMDVIVEEDIAKIDKSSYLGTLTFSHTTTDELKLKLDDDAKSVPSGLAFDIASGSRLYVTNDFERVKGSTLISVTGTGTIAFQGKSTPHCFSLASGLNIEYGSESLPAGGLSGGAIAGISITVLVIIGAGVVFLFLYFKRRRERRLLDLSDFKYDDIPDACPSNKDDSMGAYLIDL